MAEYKLTYFNIRGLAEPIRMIFALAKVDYVDNRIEREAWPAMKPTTRWGHLPILTVGDFELAESLAIIRYLARTFNLTGANDMEAARCDEIADALTELGPDFRRAVFETDEKKKAELMSEFVENHIKRAFGKVNEIKEENGGDWIVGKKLTWVDISVANAIETDEAVFGFDFKKHFPALKAMQQKVYAIPEIKEWIEKRPKTPM